MTVTSELTDQLRSQFVEAVPTHAGDSEALADALTAIVRDGAVEREEFTMRFDCEKNGCVPVGNLMADPDGDPIRTHPRDFALSASSGALTWPNDGWDGSLRRLHAVANQARWWSLSISAIATRTLGCC